MFALSRKVATAIALLCAFIVGCESKRIEKEATRASPLPSDWQNIDVGEVSISAPSGWKFHRLQGIDSVGEFVGDGVRLEFDYGPYSNSLDEQHEPEYLVVHERIDGLQARIVSPHSPGRGLTGVYSPAVLRGDRFNLYGLHSFRHTVATAMDSLGIPLQLRRQRLGHSGNSVTDNYTHTFTEDERNAAEKLGELFGTGWPEIDKGNVISFPSLSQKEEGSVGSIQQTLVNQ
jgi:hypothetical protein